MLAFTRASKVSAITNLNFKFTTRSGDKYIFRFDKLQKSSRKVECITFTNVPCFSTG